MSVRVFGAVFPFLLISAGAVSAQESQVFTTLDSADDAVEAVEDQIQDDFEDASRPSNGSSFRRLGWRGSVSASGAATSGNTDTFDVGIGARFGYGTQLWDHDFAFAYNYGEENDLKSANRFLGSYDAARYFNSRFYGFGDLRYSYDDFGAYEQDLFAGTGLGYHVVDTASTAWRVQAGPGYRRLVNHNGSTEDEAAAAISSKLWWSISDTAVLSNDTDVIWSETDTLIANDFGVTFALSGALSLRTSLRTEYHTDPLPGRDDTDNTFGVSLIYQFN